MQIWKANLEQMTNLVELPSIAILTVQVPHSMKSLLLLLLLSFFLFLGYYSNIIKF